MESISIAMERPDYFCMLDEDFRLFNDMENVLLPESNLSPEKENCEYSRSTSEENKIVEKDIQETINHGSGNNELITVLVEATNPLQNYLCGIEDDQLTEQIKMRLSRMKEEGCGYTNQLRIFHRFLKEGYLHRDWLSPKSLFMDNPKYVMNLEYVRSVFTSLFNPGGTATIHDRYLFRFAEKHNIKLVRIKEFVYEGIKYNYFKFRKF